MTKRIVKRHKFLTVREMRRGHRQDKKVLGVLKILANTR